MKKGEFKKDFNKVATTGVQLVGFGIQLLNPATYIVAAGYVIKCVAELAIDEIDDYLSTTIVVTPPMVQQTVELSGDDFVIVSDD